MILFNKEHDDNSSLVCYLFHHKEIFDFGFLRFEKSSSMLFIKNNEKTSSRNSSLIPYYSNKRCLLFRFSPSLFSVGFSSIFFFFLSKNFLFSWNPNERLTPSQGLNHPWINQIHRHPRHKQRISISSEFLFFQNNFSLIFLFRFN